MVNRPESDDYHDDFAALDFSSAGSDQDPGTDALHDYAPPLPEDATGTASDLDTLQSLTEAEEEDDLELFTVTNPQGSVSVSALMDGRIQHVALTNKVESWPEAKLAEEIFVIADLARQKARAAQYTLMLESMSEAGNEEESTLLREFVGMTMNLPTPEQAAAAQEEVFATRYDVDYTARYNGDND